MNDARHKIVTTIDHSIPMSAKRKACPKLVGLTQPKRGRPSKRYGIYMLSEWYVLQWEKSGRNSPFFLWIWCEFNSCLLGILICFYWRSELLSFSHQVLGTRFWTIYCTTMKQYGFNVCITLSQSSASTISLWKKRKRGRRWCPAFQEKAWW